MPAIILANYITVHYSDCGGGGDADSCIAPHRKPVYTSPFGHKVKREVYSDEEEEEEQERSSRSARSVQTRRRNSATTNAANKGGAGRGKLNIRKVLSSVDGNIASVDSRRRGDKTASRKENEPMAGRIGVQTRSRAQQVARSRPGGREVNPIDSSSKDKGHSLTTTTTTTTALNAGTPSGVDAGVTSSPRQHSRFVGKPSSAKRSSLPAFSTGTHTRSADTKTRTKGQDTRATFTSPVDWTSDYSSNDSSDEFTLDALEMPDAFSLSSDSD